VKKSSEQEVTIIVARHIKPGFEKKYQDWMHRVAKEIEKCPGFRGISMIAPTDEPDLWYLVYRFSDKKHLNKWQTSAIRKEFLAEVKTYTIQHYARATGLETWFALHDHPNAPPRWKMALTSFSGVFIVGIVSRAILTPVTKTWNVVAATALYGGITVAVLTWFYMPHITRLLRRWLYPNQ
jgi:uncharacterized protein